MTTKTDCHEHRLVGYAYRYTPGARADLACRACGLPQSRHETMAETLARLTEGR